jgi:hypothetical protein
VPHDDSGRAIADRWQRVVRSLDPMIRSAYMRHELTSAEPTQIADALERVCTAGEQAEPAACELLHAVVEALERPDIAEVVQRLREEAAGRSLVALARLVRRPLTSSADSLNLSAGSVPPGADAGLPAAANSRSGATGGDGKARALTLGERKALARRPTRASMDRLLGDPHPDVVRTLLDNPRLTESDVVRLAARRPGVPPVLREIARNPRWSHRPRVRMALVLNPGSPAELVIPLLALLVRPELELVLGSPGLDTAVRAAAGDRLARRPPVAGPPRGSSVH